MAAPMTRAEVDQTLAVLSGAYDRIAAAMFALDDHPGLTHLSGAGLTGTSREVADEVHALMAMLWAQFSALRQHLELAKDTRGARSRPGDQELARLTSLLRDPVVGLDAGGTPVEAAPARRLTLAELAQGLETSSGQLADLLAEVDVAVSAVVSRLAGLTDALAQARTLAADVGDDGLDAVEAELGHAHSQALADPVVVARGGAVAAAVSDTLHRLSADLDAVQARLADLARVRDRAPLLLARLEEAIAEVAAGEAEAARTHAVVRVKIADPGLPEVPAAAAGLRDRLARLDPLRQQSRWARLRDELVRLERATADALGYARRLSAAAGGLLERRIELRGRLDAYRAKAARSGYGEHPELSACHREAHRLLYTSPCDLPAATRAVFRYQETLAALISAPPRGAKEKTT